MGFKMVFSCDGCSKEMDKADVKDTVLGFLGGSYSLDLCGKCEEAYTKAVGSWAEKGTKVAAPKGAAPSSTPGGKTRKPVVLYYQKQYGKTLDEVKEGAAKHGIELSKPRAKNSQIDEVAKAEGWTAV